MESKLTKGFQFKTPESDNWSTTKDTWKLITFFLSTDTDVLWDPAYYDGKSKVIFEELGFKMLHEKRDVFEEGTFSWAKENGVTKIVCK